MKQREKKEKLELLWKKFRKFKFPHNAAGNMILAHLIAELADLDGYTAGLITSYLQGENISKWELQIDADLNAKFRSIIPKNKSEEKAIADLIAYKKKIDEMTKLLIDLTNEDK